MILKTLRTSLVLVGLGLAFGASANAGVINLVSGQGTIGSADSAVQVLVGPSSTDFTSPPSFNLANYIAASVVAPNSHWTAAIAGSQWDSINPTGSNPPAGESGATGMYAISFATGGFASATLSGSYASDNYISAIYINGVQVIGQLPGGFISASTLASTDISSYLNQNGTNTLYIDSVNTGGPSGLLFNFTINTVGVPEPSSLAMVGIAGLMGFGFHVRRKRSIA